MAQSKIIEIVEKYHEIPKIKMVMFHRFLSVYQRVHRFHIFGAWHAWHAWHAWKRVITCDKSHIIPCYHISGSFQLILPTAFEWLRSPFWGAGSPTTSQGFGVSGSINGVSPSTSSPPPTMFFTMAMMWFLGRTARTDAFLFGYPIVETELGKVFSDWEYRIPLLKGISH